MPVEQALVKEILRRIYHNLPGVRDIRSLETMLVHKLLELNRRHSLQHQLQIDEYSRQLLSEARYSHPKNLNRHEFKVYSQFGEDGVIAEIFRRIGVSTRTFVEIGVGDGLENNTTYLLLQGWRGSWLEGDKKQVEQIRRTFSRPLAEGVLQVRESFVTAENVADLVAEMKVKSEPDLLSLDVDQNTYYVWAALAGLRPRVVVIEYNSNFPAGLDWKVPYHPGKVWDGSFYYGASLKALELLGLSMDYVLVGCPISGNNAFFVRRDLANDHFEQPATAEHHYQPPRFFLYSKAGHPPGFA